MQPSVSSPQSDADPMTIGFGKYPSWMFVISLIAMAPLFHTIMTWDSDGRLTTSAFTLRHFSVPVLIVELGVIWIASRCGFDLTNTISKLTMPMKCSLLIWLVFATIAAAYENSNPILSAFLTLRYLLHGLVLAAIVHILNQDGRINFNLWLAVLTLGAIFYFLALVIFIALIPEPHNFPWVHRLPSATNVRQIGNNLALLAIAPVAALLAKDGRHKAGYFLANMLIIAFVAWTGTRGGLVGLTLGTIFAVAMTLQFTTVRNISLLIVSCSLGLLISLLMFAPAPQFGLFRIVSSVYYEDTSSGRIEMWMNTAAEIAKRPFVGFGSGSFRENMIRLYGFDNNHPHNVVLQYVYDWGILGGGAALSMLALLGWQILKAQNKRPIIRFFSITGFTATLTMAMIEGTLFHPLPILIAIAMIAPALSLVNKAR